MAHQRILKSEFFTDYDVSQMPPLQRLFFQALWCQADRAGTLEDKPQELKVRCMPYDNLDAVAAIADLVERKFLVRYRVADKSYLSVRSWAENQSVHANEKGSRLPDLSKATEIYNPGKLPVIDGQLPESSPQLSALPSPIPVPIPAPVPVPVAAPGLRQPRQVAGSVKVEKPKTPRETWGSTEFQRWAQFLRQEQGYVPEDPIPLGEVEKWWSVVMDWSGGEVRPMCSGYVKFGQDNYWENQGFPFRGFMDQWKQYCRKEVAHAAG